ncbi:hypothetical protein BY996DRAFT_6420712 [Phakopsora pachyrhizi]|nr:hypothetical protein BY996DRAFT_6420712 [Phakopsora pachyrhizi]
MNPSSIIMNNEIQEISGEEYKRNLEDARKVATHLAQAFQSMPLPRSLKIQATKLFENCEIPEDKQIQVLGPTISTTEELSRRLRKQPTPPKAQVDTSPPLKKKKKKPVEILSLITVTDHSNPPPSGCEISGEIQETSSCPPPEVLDNLTRPIFSEGGKNSHPVIDPPVNLQLGYQKEQNCSSLSSHSVLLPPEANLDCPVMNVLEGENLPPPRSSIFEDVRIENYCANDTLECLENHGGDNGESAIEEANPLNLTIQKPPPNKTSAPIAQQTSTSAQSSTEITQCSTIVASESILALNPHLTASSPPSNISANLVPPSTEENVNGNDDVLNIQSEQSQSIIGINIQKDTGGKLTILEQDPTFICPTKSKKDLTIIVDPDLRIQLYKGFHFFQSGRASSQKYSKAWNSILNFVLWL